VGICNPNYEVVPLIMFFGDLSFATQVMRLLMFCARYLDLYWLLFSWPMRVFGKMFLLLSTLTVVVLLLDSDTYSRLLLSPQQRPSLDRSSKCRPLLRPSTIGFPDRCIYAQQHRHYSSDSRADCCHPHDHEHDRVREWWCSHTSVNA